MYYYHASPEAGLSSLRAGTCVSSSLPTVGRINELMDDTASALRWGQPVYMYRIHTQSVEDRTEWIADGDTTSVSGVIQTLTATVPVATPVVIA